MNKFFTFLFIVVTGVFLAHTAYAGFGVTPPYVRNSSLTKNSVYEQNILLVRSDPSTTLKAEITIDVPGVNEWFTIKEGQEFLLPRGEQKIPMTVRVEVPDDAEFKNYSGNIRVRTSAAAVDEEVPAGAVSIALGAQVDVDIAVIDKEIRDFRVRKIGISDLNEGRKVGWLFFPGKMRFDMSIENTGNIDVAPSRVVFRLYDFSGQVLLEETEHTNNIKKIAPFDTQNVVAELPVRLPAGSYIGRYEIYNGDEVKQNGELTVNVMPYGTVQAAGYGFLGLSLAHKISVLLPLFVVLSVIIVFLIQRTKTGTSRRAVRKGRE